MSEDKTLGGGAPAGANAQENNSAASDKDDIDKDIEEIIKKEIPDEEDDDDDEDTVVIPKKKLDRLQSNLNNYKTGLVSVKDKYLKKGGDKGKQASKESTKKPTSDDDSPVTKADLRKGYEKDAIAEACKDEEVEKNWAEIVKYYSPRHGKDNPKDILKDIKDAKILWKAEKAESEDTEEEDDDKKSAAEIAAEKSKQSGTALKSKSKETKHILPQKTSVKDWYPKPDAKK